MCKTVTPAKIAKNALYFVLVGTVAGLVIVGSLRPLGGSTQ